MPTRTHRVGDHEWYDEVGEFDEDRRDQEPGYSTDNDGCFSIILVLFVVGLFIAERMV